MTQQHIVFLTGAGISAESRKICDDMDRCEDLGFKHIKAKATVGMRMLIEELGNICA